MPMARVFLALSAIFAIAEHICKRKRFSVSLPGWGFAAYFAVAFIVSAAMALTCSDNLLVPAEGFRKLDKLMWYLGIPLAATLTDSRQKLIETFKAFTWGCAVTAAMVVLFNPAGAWLQSIMPSKNAVARGIMTDFQRTVLSLCEQLGVKKTIYEWIYDGYRAKTFTNAIIKLGTMEDAQRLMAALPVSLWLAVHNDFKQDGGSKSARRRLASCALPLLIFLGLFVTFKRGPLFIAVAVSLPVLFRAVSRKTVAALVLIFAAAACIIPASRKRITDLPGEFSQEKGGRMAMWTIIAPELRREFPNGIGFRSLTNEKMRSIYKEVEQRQNHLHSVPVQSLIDFGYPGLAAYVLWMILALYIPISAMRGGDPEAYAPAAVILSLMIYGLIEYNLADSEIVLLYTISMGSGSSAYFSQKKHKQIQD